MSATITYKGSTLTTVSNNTIILNTSGTWMEDDIVITDVAIPDGNNLAYGYTRTAYTDDTQSAITGIAITGEEENSGGSND